MKSRKLLLTSSLVLLALWFVLTFGGFTFGASNGGVFGWGPMRSGYGMMGGGMGPGMMGGRMGPGMMGGWSGDAPASGSTPDSGREADVEVDLRNIRFNPDRIVVKAGETVRFTNRDGFAHNVIQASPETLGKGDGLFQSPTLAAGESWSYTFEEPGTYPILCSVGGHYRAGMVGEVVVEPAE